MAPTSRAPVHPALGSAGGLSGGGGSGLTSGVVGALGSGGLVGPMGSPLGSVGAYSDANALYLPYKYRSATALHTALALAPSNTVGELWGPSGFIMRCILATQGAARRLLPLGLVYLSNTSSTGAEWDGDYAWVPIDTATPAAWNGAALGLTLSLDGALECRGLARFVVSRMAMYATTAALTFSGSPTAILPRIYAGYWRRAAGISAGLAAWGAQGTLASALWSRAQYQADPDAPTLLGSATGALAAPTAQAVRVGGSAWGVDLVSPRALFGGSWQPPLDALGTSPAANASMGSAGDGFAPCVGALAGDATAPAEVTIQSFEMYGDLAAA